MVSKWCQTSNGVALTLENSGIEHMNLHSMIECKSIFLVKPEIMKPVFMQVS